MCIMVCKFTVRSDHFFLFCWICIFSWQLVQFDRCHWNCHALAQVNILRCNTWLRHICCSVMFLASIATTVTCPWPPPIWKAGIAPLQRYGTWKGRCGPMKKRVLRVTVGGRGLRWGDDANISQISRMWSARRGSWLVDPGCFSLSEFVSTFQIGTATSDLLEEQRKLNTLSTWYFLIAFCHCPVRLRW